MPYFVTAKFWFSLFFIADALHEAFDEWVVVFYYIGACYFLAAVIGISTFLGITISKCRRIKTEPKPIVTLTWNSLFLNAADPFIKSMFMLIVKKLKWKFFSKFFLHYCKKKFSVYRKCYGNVFCQPVGNQIHTGSIILLLWRRL